MVHFTSITIIKGVGIAPFEHTHFSGIKSQFIWAPFR